MVRSVLIAILVATLAHCQQRNDASDLFLQGRSLGKNKNEKLEEASGLVASERNKGMLWTHNDGGKAQLFLLDTNAVTLKVFTLAGVHNRDWEDIALGPGPEPGVPYLYVGNIGDNFAKFPFKHIYRLKEPSIDDAVEITDFESFKIRMSDEPRDSEALMIDPLTKNLYLVTKRDSPVGLYEISGTAAGEVVEARRIADLPVRYIVAGDISADGSEVLLKSYDEVYYWKRNGSEPLADLLKTEPARLPYDREPQGESIAWARDGSGYYTLSENARGERSKLIFYKRR